MKSNSILPAVALSKAPQEAHRRSSLAHGLLALLQRRERRRRNLAELRALDGDRLGDIGLSEEARARIAG